MCEIYVYEHTKENNLVYPKFKFILHFLLNQIKSLICFIYQGQRLE